MGLYLGSEKIKTILNNELFCLNLLPSLSPIVNGALLKTSEDYIWKDLNELYLTAKESE